MKIGKPVKSVPERSEGNTKYALIWKALDRLEDGQWLPISFDSEAEYETARRSMSAIRGIERRNDKSTQTIFLRRIQKRGDSK